MPQSVTGRTFLSLWWLFSIITMATYSGNLIAFLTVNKEVLPFKDIVSMVAQSSYAWGTIGGSSYVDVFSVRVSRLVILSLIMTNLIFIKRA